MTYLIEEKKYSIFLIAVVGSIAILSFPLIFNQVLEAEHLIHVAIHEIGFVLAAFLSIMAGIAYMKTRIFRMLFSSFAFGVLGFGQVAYMYSEILQPYHGGDTFGGGDILDITILIMTILFAVGVFYRRLF
ncbi:hypothetical protein OAJ55_01515 [Candidatus Nitrosopelagicus sp.]|nr:hypothetical protein [Candidatus Nitrosopelagicus sp.]